MDDLACWNRDALAKEKSMTLARIGIAKAAKLKDGVNTPIEFAEGRWGPLDPATRALKNFSVTGDWTSGESAAAVEFFQYVDPSGLLGKLPLTRVPSRTWLILDTTGATAYWVGEGAAKTSSKPTLTADALDPRHKVTALWPFTDELLEDGKPSTETLVRDILARRVRAATDAALIDPLNDGSGARPASITYGATALPSQGDIEADVDQALGAFNGDPADAWLVIHSRLAARIGLKEGAGVGANVGVRGGTIAGIPVATTVALPHDTSGTMFALVDPTGIAFADDGGSVRKSNQADITIGGTTLHMWQQHLAAIVVERRIVWKVVRPGAVVVVNAISY